MVVPVWHEAARERVEAGELRLVGLTQEQHPDRCRLYAQWKGYDFPILWDPFNLTRSRAVPIVMGVDSAGVLRTRRLNARQPEASLTGFLEQQWPAVIEEPARPYEAIDRRAAGGDTRPDDPRLAAQKGIARLLFHRPLHDAPPTARVFEESLRELDAYAGLEDSPPSARFRLGVAYRLRCDSPHRRPGDFQASLDAWMAALHEEPGQYIWRRRIQQWGPRLDKPYPFYDWVSKARSEIEARGEEPVVVEVPLTGAEVAGSTKEIPRREHEDTHPDPGGKLPRDEGGRVTLETAAALHTGITSKRVREPAGTARVHLVLRPEEGVHWGNEAGPTRIWVEVPEGWDVRRNLWTLELPDEATSEEVRTLDFEVRPPTGPPGEGPSSPPVVRGTAFYPVCEGKSGVCTLLAREFEVRLPVPEAAEEKEEEEEGAGGR